MDFNDDQSYALVNRQAIIANRVPARWCRTLPDAEGERGVRPEYSFAQSQTNGGTYSFVSPAPVNKAQDESQATRVQCQLCPKFCAIAPGKTGACSARINYDGRLYARFYGRPASVAIDPVEKKPLYHFLPGTSILSLGTKGCNLSCKFCQNWTLSTPLPVGEEVSTILTPKQIVDVAKAKGCQSVAFTYNEPTIWAEFVVDAARLCRKENIKTVAVTNGMIVGKARETFYDAIDAANVDLKSFSPDFYRELTGGDLNVVKETLEFIAKKTNVWLETTTLLIPTCNDSDDEIRTLSRWLVESLGARVPLHFSAFFPTYKLTSLPRTPASTLHRAAEIAKEEGVEFVYLGNVDDKAGRTTVCPNCRRALIERTASYKTSITSFLEIDASRHATCKNCGHKIPGVF